jgi:hypothetical protein
MFKIGEKVVFIGQQRKPKFEGFKFPQVNEIVTIHAICGVKSSSYYVSEYLIDNNGNPQSFMPDNFRKLDHSFAENLLEKIKQEVSNDKVAHAVC